MAMPGKLLQGSMGRSVLVRTVSGIAEIVPLSANAAGALRLTNVRYGFVTGQRRWNHPERLLSCTPTACFRLIGDLCKNQYSRAGI